MCNFEIDRDLNAAINLSNLGVDNSDVMPVEMEALAGDLVAGETAVCEPGTERG